MCKPFLGSINCGDLKKEMEAFLDPLIPKAAKQETQKQLKCQKVEEKLNGQPTGRIKAADVLVKLALNAKRVGGLLIVVFKNRIKKKNHSFIPPFLKLISSATHHEHKIMHNPVFSSTVAAVATPLPPLNNKQF